MTDGKPGANMFAAGEIMAGNVLGKGYVAGIGMTIGTVFGRIAGEEAAARMSARARLYRKRAQFAHASICNACRYCEGYCAVFPRNGAAHRVRSRDLHYLANLCHNCGACYYACQYAPPHEFAVNVPRMLAQVRLESYRRTHGRRSRRTCSSAAGSIALVMAGSLALSSCSASRGAAMASSARTRTRARSTRFFRTTCWLRSSASLSPLRALRHDGSRAFLARNGEPRHQFVTARRVCGAMHDAAALKYLDGGGDGCSEADQRRRTARARISPPDVLRVSAVPGLDECRVDLSLRLRLAGAVSGGSACRCSWARSVASGSGDRPVGVAVASSAPTRTATIIADFGWTPGSPGCCCSQASRA